MRDFLRHLFLPRESNNHRPKILHHQSLFFIIISLIAFQIFLSAVKTNFSGVLGTSTSISVERLLELTNQKRAENGLEKITLNDQLSRASMLKAQYMFVKNYWAHTAPDGTSPWYFLKQVDYDYTYAGENLARGYTTSDDVVNAWMASSSHRENVLSSNYKEVGFGILQGSLLGEDTTLVVEMFGAKNMPTLSRSENTQQIVPEKPQIVVMPNVNNAELPKRQVFNSNSTLVAAVNNKPIVDSRGLSKNIAIFIVSLFIFILLVDMIIIEKKKIVRMVGHNLDHIIFLGIILIFIALLTRGSIL